MAMDREGRRYCARSEVLLVHDWDVVVYEQAMHHRMPPPKVIPAWSRWIGSLCTGRTKLADFSAATDQVQPRDRPEDCPTLGFTIPETQLTIADERLSNASNRVKVMGNDDSDCARR
jgi:hypothetical protein